MTNTHAVGHQEYGSPPPSKKRKTNTAKNTGSAVLLAAALSTAVIPAPSHATPNNQPAPISVRVQKVLDSKTTEKPKSTEKPKQIEGDTTKKPKGKKPKKKSGKKSSRAEASSPLNKVNSGGVASEVTMSSVPAIASVVHGKTAIGPAARKLYQDTAYTNEINNLYHRLSGAERGKVASYDEVLSSIKTLKDLNAVRTLVGPLVMERALSGRAIIESLEAKVLAATFEARYYPHISKQALSNFTWYAANFPSAAKYIADYYFGGNRNISGMTDAEKEIDVQHAAKIVSIATLYASKVEPVVTPIVEVASSRTTTVVPVAPVAPSPMPSSSIQPEAPVYVPPTTNVSTKQAAATSVGTSIQLKTAEITSTKVKLDPVESEVKKVTPRQFFESLPTKEIYTSEQTKDLVAVQNGRSIIDAMFIEKHPNEASFVYRMATVLLIAAKNPNSLNSDKNPSLGVSGAVAHLALKLRVSPVKEKLLKDIVIVLLASGGADAFDLAAELNVRIGGLSEYQVGVVVNALRESKSENVRVRYRVATKALKDDYEGGNNAR